MGQRSAIEWTDATWNPWHGCTKVSPGCKHCYMYREKRQYGQDPNVIVRSKTTFTAPLKWGAPRRIFTCSWSDFFHEAADPWRADTWEIIERTPQHTYLILSKRPERIRENLPWAARVHGSYGWLEPWRNVWLGVSVENQDYGGRIDQLLGVPAMVHFLSLEPLLGPIDLSPWLRKPLVHGRPIDVEWVIVGGESGPNARRMELGWAASLLEQCRAAGVPFFLKQLGGWPDKRGGDKALLQGRLWREIPV